jgi:GT2 family glycosyltransferase
VVVATYRRADRLPRLIASLEAQHHRPAEVVLVDDASHDGTATVLAEIAASAQLPVRVLTREVNGGPAAARETGWRAAQHDLVAFTDDDCVPRPGWLAALVGHEGVVVGRTVAAPDQLAQRGVFSRTVEVADEALGQTCNILYPRAVLTQLDGFDTRLRTGEDTDLALRAREAGIPVTFAAEAVVEHDVRPSSLAAAVREAWHWSDLPAVVRRHPGLRERLYGRLWWKPAHPPALLAVAGLLLSRRHPSGLVLALPWLHRRWVIEEVAGVSPRRRAAALPGQLLVDLVEVAAMARGSAEHKTLML